MTPGSFVERLREAERFFGGRGKVHRTMRRFATIELKLSAGTLPMRLRDHADALDLITALGLPREIGEKLDASVRDEYYRLWNVAATGYDPSAE